MLQTTTAPNSSTWSWSSFIPLTAAGLLTVGLGIVCYAVGWFLGWVELVVAATGAALAILLAIPFVIGRTRLSLVRQISPARVTVGERAEAIVSVDTERHAVLRRLMVEDSVDGHRVPIEVPPLGKGEIWGTTYQLPTIYRGVVKVGPAVVSRRDPLQLMRSDVQQLRADTLIVHPRHLVLPPLPVGFAKDLEGPTSDTSPAGDVAFHTLREYQPGDDYRHIHWMTTARLNKPVVRHYVDNRRPRLLIVLDDRVDSLPNERPQADSYSDPFARVGASTGLPPGSLFDGALEAVASFGVSALLRQEPIAIWNTSGPLFGNTKPGSPHELLDHLTTAEPVAEGDPLKAALLGVRNEPGISAVVLVTGPLPAEDLILFARQIRRRAHPIICRVWPEGDVVPGRVPGAKVIDFDTLAGFRQAWEGVRR